MNCRPNCAACCIAPSISSAIPGMPNGKPAGVPCVQLATDLSCKIFGQPTRPSVCSSLQANVEMCGDHTTQSAREHAMIWLRNLEQATLPTI